MLLLLLLLSLLLLSVVVVVVGFKRCLLAQWVASLRTPVQTFFLHVLVRPSPDGMELMDAKDYHCQAVEPPHVLAALPTAPAASPGPCVRSRAARRRERRQRLDSRRVITRSKQCLLKHCGLLRLADAPS